MEIRTVGVVGCGLMGSGIAEVIAKTGYDVVVKEVEQRFLDTGFERIRTSMGRAVERNKLAPEERDAAYARIRGSTDFADLGDCDFVIEAIVENLDAKKALFAELDRATPPHAILASNTSSLSIAEMASVTQRPEKVLGFHFFNPAPVMPLLELVRSFMTGDETCETARALAEKCGKTVVVAKDGPGFIVNALLVPYLLDAARMLEEGTASREDIDTGVKLGLAHPMGPLTLLDYVGVDTTLFIADAMFEETKNSRYAAPVLMRRMVTMGHNGRKSGRGFYEYS